MKHIFLLSLTALCTLPAAAQHIGFEQKDYRAIGVYDRWERSPFRDGRLTGEATVCANPDRRGNGSDSVVAFVRSRHASNIYGVRIDLPHPFALTPQGKVVHVLVHRPQGGRVMLVGLGKRRDRQGQQPDVEQFWTYADAKVPCGQWTDAVFAVKSANGVDIHSLVLVPDAESPHQLEADWTAYVDDILVDDIRQPRINATDLQQSAAATTSTADRPVHPVTASVTAASRNGTVVTADGTTLNNFAAPLSHPLSVKVLPAPGFGCKGVRIRYGRALAGPQTVEGRQMWQETYIGSEHIHNGLLDIPARCLAEEVEVEGDFVSEQ